MSKPPVTIGVNPHIVLYTFLLSGVCGIAYYYDKKRDESMALKTLDDHDYVDHSREGKLRSERMASTVRKGDFQVERRMNDIVWGGRTRLDREGGDEGKKANYDTYSNRAARSGQIQAGNGGGGGDGEEIDVKALVAGVEPTSAKSDVAVDGGASATEAAPKKRRRRKRKVVPVEDEAEKEMAAKLEAANAKLEAEKQRTVLLVIGVVAAAAVSVLSNNKRS